MKKLLLDEIGTFDGTTHTLSAIALGERLHMLASEYCIVSAQFLPCSCSGMKQSGHIIQGLSGDAIPRSTSNWLCSTFPRPGHRRGTRSQDSSSDIQIQSIFSAFLRVYLA
jgi:hypothetical protein